MNEREQQDHLNTRGFDFFLQDLERGDLPEFVGFQDIDEQPQDNSFVGGLQRQQAAFNDLDDREPIVYSVLNPTGEPYTLGTMEERQLRVQQVGEPDLMHSYDTLQRFFEGEGRHLSAVQQERLMAFYELNYSLRRDGYPSLDEITTQIVNDSTLRHIIEFTMIRISAEIDLEHQRELRRERSQENNPWEAFSQIQISDTELLKADLSRVSDMLCLDFKSIEEEECNARVIQEQLAQSNQYTSEEIQSVSKWLENQFIIARNVEHINMVAMQIQLLETYLSDNPKYIVENRLYDEETPAFNDNRTLHLLSQQRERIIGIEKLLKVKQEQQQKLQVSNSSIAQGQHVLSQSMSPKQREFLQLIEHQRASLRASQRKKTRRTTSQHL